MVNYASEFNTIKMCNIETVMPSTITYKYHFHSKCFARMILQFTNLRHLEIVNTSNLMGGNVMRIVRHAKVIASECRRVSCRRT